LFFKDFELEDLYNLHESDYDFSLSTACLDPINLSSLLNLEEAFNGSFLDEILNLPLDYSNKYGDTQLISALAEIYGELSFLSSSGASEAIALSMFALLKQGDTVIIQRPIYPSLLKIPESLGCKIISWRFNWSEDFEINLDSLKKLIKAHPQTKALIINNPNNPSGYAFNKAELLDLISVIDGRYLISDEVFLDLSLKPLSPVVKLYEKGISISDIGKSYGLQGLRIGWLVSHEKSFIEKCLGIKSYFSLRSSSLGERISSLVLKQRAQLLAQSHQKIQSCLNRVFMKPKEIDILAARGQGSVSLDPDKFAGLTLLAKIHDHKIDELFQKLIQERIFILPGRVFGEEYSEYFRLSVIKV